MGLPPYAANVPQFTEPTILWRLRRGPARAHATIFSAADYATIAWFFDDMMDRVENYDTLELAMARADDIRGVLLRDGWVEEPGAEPGT